MRRSKLQEKLRAARTEALSLRDELDDLRAGLALWLERKTTSGEWTVEDESLARWVQAGERS